MNHRKNFRPKDIFWSQKIFGPKIFFDLKNLSGQKIIWTWNFSDPNFFDPKLFLTQHVYWPKNFVDQKFFFDPNFLWPLPQLFLDPNFFNPNIFDPKILRALKYFLTKDIFENNYLGTGKVSFPEIYLTQKNLTMKILVIDKLGLSCAKLRAQLSSQLSYAHSSNKLRGK